MGEVATEVAASNFVVQFRTSGPLEHNGSVATLEDWFDPRRLNDDYVPTGFKGAGIQARPVRGHRFGLSLPPEDRQALIAFLKTL